MIVGMTLSARHAGMTARQFKCKATVIETAGKAVNAIVAIQTGRTISRGVRVHETGIDLTVTRSADSRIECTNASSMTIFTGE